MTFRPARAAAISGLALAGTLVPALLPAVSAGAGAAAVVFADGFEAGNLTSWTTVASATAQKQYVRTGTWAAQVASTGAPAYLRKKLATASPSLQLNTAANVVSQGSTVANLMTVKTATGTPVLGLFRTAKGVLAARNYVTATTTQSTTTVTKGSWHSFGLAVQVGNPGRVDVVMNGQTVTALSGARTLGTTSLGQVELGDTARSRTFKIAFDDVAVSGSDTQPPTTARGVVAMVPPAADKVTVAWVPASDNVAVAGYDVYRDGVLVGATDQHPVVVDSTVRPGAAHDYTVVTRDTAGNSSPPSAPAHADVPSVPAPEEPLGARVPDMGVVIHATWPYYTDADRRALLDNAVDLGLDWVRIAASWARIQPRQPTETDPGYALTGYVATLDSTVEMARARGLDVHLMLNATPNWANGGKGPKVLPTDPADYARVAQWAAGRYQGAVTSWEVYNEPNLAEQTVATPSEYTRLLCAAYAALHSGDPATTVVSAGTAGNDWQFIDAMYVAGARGCFDVLATHPYQSYALPPEYPAQDAKRWWTDNIRLVRNVMVTHGDEAVPVWFTEYGWSTHDNFAGIANIDIGVTPEEQATYLVDMITMTMRRYPYVERMAVYQVRDENNGNLRNDNFGLYTLGGQRKPSADRLEAFMTLHGS